MASFGQQGLIVWRGRRANMRAQTGQDSTSLARSLPPSLPPKQSRRQWRTFNSECGPRFRRWCLSCTRAVPARPGAGNTADKGAGRGGPDKAPTGAQRGEGGAGAGRSSVQRVEGVITTEALCHIYARFSTKSPREKVAIFR